MVSQRTAILSHIPWKDYVLLTKPIIVVLLLMTTLGAMIVAADDWPAMGLVLTTMLGGGLSAGGASALNQVIDRERDSKMQRTKNRPIPAGRMTIKNASVFGLSLCLAGLVILALGVNLLSALLAFIGMVYYLIVYSILLKTSTPQNIVLGGGAGAMPVLIGWAAGSGSLSIEAWLLFALVFFWTPPHFWALALIKQQDYARAGIPMFPVVYGDRETKRQILLYSIQLVALTLIIPFMNLGGYFFLFLAVLLGGILILLAARLWRGGGNRRAWIMYRYSSLYLALIFSVLIFEKLLF